MADGGIINPGRLVRESGPPHESVDKMGVFTPNEHGVSVVVPGDDPGALGVPGVTDIAAMPDPAAKVEAEPEPPEPGHGYRVRIPEQSAKPKMTKEERVEFMRKLSAKGRAVQAAKREAKKAEAEAVREAAKLQAEAAKKQTVYEEAARAQSMVQRASAPPPARPARREVPSSAPAKLPQINPRWASVVISLPDMTTRPMDEVEISIIKAREELDRYAKEAQRLRMASRDRVCQFCGKVVEDGRWYARECPVDPNGRLTHDWVWCSQPCHISWVVRNQTVGHQPEAASINFKYR